MPSPSWENLDEFLDPADFAVPATIEFQDGTTRVVNGIFDDPYMNAELGEYDLDTTKPRLLCKESDLAGVARYARVRVQGDPRSYEVQSAPQSTGDGMAVLALEVFTEVARR